MIKARPFAAFGAWGHVLLLAQTSGGEPPPTWTIVGAAAALLALGTALVELRTARMNRLAVGSSIAEPPPFQGTDLLPPRRRIVNRETELEEAEARIRTGEMILAIEGDPGIGKSAVAAELVHRLREPRSEARELRDHTFVWLNAEYGCPSLSAICQALGLLTGDQSLTTAPRRYKLDALRAHLAAHKTVLVLDNLRLTGEPASESLRAFLRSVPAGAVVIASISRPAELEGARVHLRELDPPHVLELVRQQADQLGLGPPADFDEAFALRLQTALGGNPKLIAWFLRAYESSPDALEERLEAVERGERFPEFLAPIWRELDAPAKTVLGACAFLRGEAVREQLVVACAISEEEVAEVLAALMRRGLVDTLRATGRSPVYTCAPALRTYVRNALPDALAASFTRRLSAAYIDRFADDWEDARGAIPHVAAFLVLCDELDQRGDDRTLQALFAAVLDILFTLGLFDARISTGTLAHGSAVRAGNHRAASLAASVISSTHAIRGEIASAREAVALGLVAAEAAGDPAEIARQRRCRGFVCYRDRDARGALGAIDGAEELALAGGDLRGLVDILGLRTAAHWYLGNVEAAEAAAEECLRVCDEISWQRGRAYPLRDLAEIAIHRRRLDHARELVEQARSAAAGAEDRRHLARLELTWARLQLVGRRPREAVGAASRAERASRELGLPPEAQEARAVRRAASRAQVFAPLRLYHAWRRPRQLTDAPVAGD